jgi:hypothetical protein
MKAEQRKEIETNSIVLLVQRLRKHVNWRTGYYVIGTLVLAATAIILYRYFTDESRRAHDAILAELDSADTAEKLKKGMEEHRGTLIGSMFKLHLARHLLKNDGLPKVGTENSTAQQQAANAIAEAKGYYLELTAELPKQLQEKENAGLIQEAWLSAAQAEEALVGLPTAAGGSDSRGDADKVVEYYEKAGAIFPDTDFSKRYRERAEKLKANKEQFVSAQKALYKQYERSSFGTGKDPFGPPPIPDGPKLPGSFNFPPFDAKTPETKLPEMPKIEVPPIPSPPVVEKGPEPRAVTPSKPADPKAKQ